MRTRELAGQTGQWASLHSQCPVCAVFIIHPHPVTATNNTGASSDIGAMSLVVKLQLKSQQNYRPRLVGLGRGPLALLADLGPEQRPGREARPVDQRDDGRGQAGARQQRHEGEEPVAHVDAEHVVLVEPLGHVGRREHAALGQLVQQQVQAVLPVAVLGRLARGDLGRGADGEAGWLAWGKTRTQAAQPKVPVVTTPENTVIVKQA